jgi:hypothetical protein
VPVVFRALEFFVRWLEELVVDFLAAALRLADVVVFEAEAVPAKACVTGPIPGKSRQIHAAANRYNVLLYGIHSRSNHWLPGATFAQAPPANNPLL